MNLSFIVPAYNEEEAIRKLFRSVVGTVSESFQYEVIVVDNGSDDRTTSVAKEYGARVLERASGTVAALRNLGASQASTDVLVFLDADVILTELWARNLP